MARTARRALILALGGALLLGGCGRKGALDPPGGPVEDTTANPEKTPDAQKKADPAAPERVLETPHKP